MLSQVLPIIYLLLIDIKYPLFNQLRNRRQERDASIGLNTTKIFSSILQDNDILRKFKLEEDDGLDEILNQVTESIWV
jgi:hypothetical protein